MVRVLSVFVYYTTFLDGALDRLLAQVRAHVRQLRFRQWTLSNLEKAAELNETDQPTNEDPEAYHQRYVEVGFLGVYDTLTTEFPRISVAARSSLQYHQESQAILARLDPGHRGREPRLSAGSFS